MSADSQYVMNRAAAHAAEGKRAIACHVVAAEARDEDPGFTADELAWADTEITARRAERAAELAAIRQRGPSPRYDGRVAKTLGRRRVTTPAEPPSTYRRLNRSRAWLAAQAAKLAQVPTCATCGMPSREMHAPSGCFTSEPRPLDETDALCCDCHDATGCTAHVGSTFVTRAIERDE